MEAFQEETRSRHREHLFRCIAWRLQALAEGDLSERARTRAQQIARDADRTVAPPDFLTVGWRARPDGARQCHVARARRGVAADRVLKIPFDSCEFRD
jgi:hypothetical protein